MASKSYQAKYKKDNKYQNQVDCVTRGDPCEGQTCEINEVCLADSEDEGFCYPKECEWSDDYDIKV